MREELGHASALGRHESRACPASRPSSSPPSRTRRGQVQRQCGVRLQAVDHVGVAAQPGVQLGGVAVPDVHVPVIKVAKEYARAHMCVHECVHMCVGGTCAEEHQGNNTRRTVCAMQCGWHVCVCVYVYASARGEVGKLRSSRQRLWAGRVRLARQVHHGRCMPYVCRQGCSSTAWPRSPAVAAADHPLLALAQEADALDGAVVAVAAAAGSRQQAAGRPAGARFLAVMASGSREANTKKGCEELSENKLAHLQLSYVHVHNCACKRRQATQPQLAPARTCTA